MNSLKKEVSRMVAGDKESKYVWRRNGGVE